MPVGSKYVVVELGGLKTPDEVKDLPPSREAIPTVAHPDGQSKPGE